MKYQCIFVIENSEDENNLIYMFQSIAEFLDGMPSFDERNFSRFHSDNGRSKRVPVYITTDDQPSDQGL